MGSPDVAAIVVEVGAVAAAVAAVAGLLWWLIAPRIRGYITNIVTGLKADVAEVREQVTPNGGSSAHDKLAKQIGEVRDDLAASRLTGERRDAQAIQRDRALARRLDGLDGKVDENTARLDSLNGVVEETRGAVADHDAKAETYLGRLSDLGIDIGQNEKET